MKRISFLFFITLCFALQAQSYWTPIRYTERNASTTTPDSHLYRLDAQALQKDITYHQAVEIPTLENMSEIYHLTEVSNMDKKLQEKYPEIKSYRGISDKGEIRMSISPKGIQAIIFKQGKAPQFLELYHKNSPTVYKLYQSKGKSAFDCLTQDEKKLTQQTYQKTWAQNGKYRIYRLAISVGGEYTQYFGGTKADALAAINATVTRINAVTEKDLAVHFNLIADQEKIIFTDPDNDPYTATDENLWLDELQTTLEDQVGEESYDIGHLLMKDGGGGLAGDIGSVCKNGIKGQGYSSSSNGMPEGASFDIDYVLHELGHQMGANHTFSRGESTGVNFEPGSGSTIMGYAGITGRETDVQQNSDPYFHHISLKQISTYLQSQDCGVLTPLYNTPPTADAGPDYTIPTQVPFVLKGKATGTSSENFLYTWEQEDNSPKVSYYTASPDDKNGPMFRSILPSPSPTRYFPSLDKVMQQNLYSRFESLSSVSRDLNFTFTVRDNQPHGQFASDKMRVKVIKTAEPFEFKAPVANQSVAKGSELEVRWSVAGTQKAPFNVSKVNLYLSTDGQTFSLLKSDVLNDGSEVVTLPNIDTKYAYLKLEAVDNIFYIISSPFSIGYEPTEVCKEYKMTNQPFLIPEGADAPYVYAEIPVQEDSKVNRVKVSVDVKHAYLGDLELKLQSPDHSTAYLISRKCWGKDDMNLTFQDDADKWNCSDSKNTAQAIDKLQSFVNKNTSGTWKVGFQDEEVGDQGKVNDVRLQLCYNEYKTLSTSSVEDTKEESVIYPNPATNEVNVPWFAQEPGVTFEIFNMIGQKVKVTENKLTQGRFIQTLPLDGIAPGVYILHVSDASQSKSYKLQITN